MLELTLEEANAHLAKPGCIVKCSEGRASKTRQGVYVTTQIGLAPRCLFIGLASDKDGNNNRFVIEDVT